MQKVLIKTLDKRNVVNMKLIVGLGNPGEKYKKTRHNLGFMVIDRFMRDFETVEKTVWKTNERMKSDMLELDWQPKEGKMEHVILAKPQTYMNNSGMAVSLISSFYKIEPEDIWIIHDELDLPIGSLRIRFGGAAAGHRGVESVIESLGTDKFWRFRLGIGIENPHSGRLAREQGHVSKISRQNLGNVENYVLNVFSEEEHNKIRDLISHASEAVSSALEKGLEKAMNRYNTK